LLDVEHAQHESAYRAVEYLLQESLRLLLPGVDGCVDHGPPLAAVFDEPLAVHDAKLGLDRIEVEFLLLGHPLMNGPNTPLPYFPQDFKDLELTISRVHSKFLAPGGLTFA